MSDSEKFWVVWCPARGVPTVTHKLYSSARMQAEALAAKHPGETFFVLVAQSASKSAAVSTVLLADPISAVGP